MISTFLNRRSKEDLLVPILCASSDFIMFPLDRGNSKKSDFNRITVGYGLSVFCKSVRITYFQDPG